MSTSVTHDALNVVLYSAGIPWCTEHLYCAWPSCVVSCQGAVVVFGMTARVCQARSATEECRTAQYIGTRAWVARSVRGLEGVGRTIPCKLLEGEVHLDLLKLDLGVVDLEHGTLLHESLAHVNRRRLTGVTCTHNALSPKRSSALKARQQLPIQHSDSVIACDK